MQIVVSGHRLAVGEAFQGHATEALSALSTKYFSRAISATATLTSGPHAAGFVCEVMMHVRGNVILKGSGNGGQALPAFDGALAKIDKQLRRHVRRLHDHNGAGHEERVALDAAYTVFAGSPAEVGVAEPVDAPLVIAEAAVDVPTASVADAVMMLDLRNTTALLFKNGRTGELNMVYRREDGNIGWVEPGARGAG